MINILFNNATEIRVNTAKNTQLSRQYNRVYDTKATIILDRSSRSRPLSIITRRIDDGFTTYIMLLHGWRKWWAFLIEIEIILFNYLSRI